MSNTVSLFIASQAPEIFVGDYTDLSSLDTARNTRQEEIKAANARAPIDPIYLTQEGLVIDGLGAVRYLGDTEMFLDLLVQTY